MAQRKFIALPDIEYRENSFEQVRIPNTERIKKIHLYMNASRTTTSWVSDGNLVGGAQDNPMRLVKNVELVADGVTLHRVDLAGLFYQDYFMNGSAPLRTAAVQTGAAVTAQAIRAQASISFIQRRAIAPVDTVLDSRRFQNLLLRVEWGDFDDVEEGASNTTEAVDSGSVMEAVIETSTGLKSVGGAAGPWISKRTYEEVEVSASNANFRFALQPSNALLRGLTVRMVDEAATQSVPHDGFNEHNIRVNNDMDWVRAEPDLVRQNVMDSELGLQTQVTGAQAITGYRHFDFAQEGLIKSQALREQLATSIDYVADLTIGGNQNLLRVYRDEILVR